MRYGEIVERINQRKNTRILFDFYKDKKLQEASRGGLVVSLYKIDAEDFLKP
jgi:hypothetical protein